MLRVSKLLFLSQMTPNKNLHRPGKIVLILMLTGLLSLGAGLCVAKEANSAGTPAITPQHNTNHRAQQSDRLPSAVANAVRQDLSRRLRVSKDDLYIVKSERRQWSDGCLGVVKPGVMCTQAIVPGWEVKVANRKDSKLVDKFWVYHTNSNGSVVVLAEDNSQMGDSATIKPSVISASELPPPLEKNAVFRSISSGGLIGRTYETVLMKDGRVIQRQITANSKSRWQEIRLVSFPDLRNFQTLAQKNLQRYNQLNFLPPPGSADYITVTFSSSNSTVRYADMIQGQLPEDLREIIKAWNQIVNQS